MVCRNEGGLDAFIVPRDAAGVRVSAREEHLGLRALPTARVDLERVELPPEARLGGGAGPIVDSTPGQRPTGTSTTGGNSSVRRARSPEIELRRSTMDHQSWTVLGSNRRNRHGTPFFLVCVCFI